MLTTRRLHSERGQATVEAVIFMPFLVGGIMALIVFGRLGVLSERAESAVRYGDMVSFRNGNAYTVSTVEAVIDEVLHGSSAELGPLCLEPRNAPSSAPAPIPTLTASAISPQPAPLPQSTSIANRVAADTIAALYQAQTAGGAPSAAPSAPPYWQPDSMGTPRCNPASIALQAGAFGAGNLPLSVQSIAISAHVNVPAYLSFAGGGGTSARMGFLNVATPNTLIACVPGLSIVLAVLQPLAQGAAGPVCPAGPVPL
jgi:hypothetical protein